MRRTALASFVGVAAAGLLAGCPDRSISEVDPVQGRVEYKDIPLNINRDVDILFVIDNSPSMADKQKNLAENFPRFIGVLDSIQGGRPNVHIAVVTSDMGSKGADIAEPGPPVGQLGMGRCAGVGDDGIMQLTGAPVTGGLYISHLVPANGAEPIRNYGDDDGDLAPAFGQMARVGAAKCGFEQHLEAMKKALQPATAPNAGFLRPNAYLAIIFIADEDDCSYKDPKLITADTNELGPLQSFRCFRYGITCDTNGENPDEMNEVNTKGRCHPNEGSPYLTDIGRYVTFLKSLKADDPSKIIVAGIMGPTEPVATVLRVPRGETLAIPALAHSCTYKGADNSDEVADPAIRLRFFMDQFPNRNTFAPICQRDLSGGLQQIGDLLKTVIGNPCIEGKLADADPSTPMPDHDCQVSYLTNYNKANENETVLEKCNTDTGTPSNAPCWRIVEDRNLCVTGENLLLDIQGKESLPTDTHVIANCVTEVVDAPAN